MALTARFTGMGLAYTILLPIACCRMKSLVVVMRSVSQAISHTLPISKVGRRYSRENASVGRETGYRYAHVVVNLDELLLVAG